MKPKVSNCCGKHGFIEVYDRILSGTNYVNSEDAGICPVCEKPCEYIDAPELGLNNDKLIV